MEDVFVNAQKSDLILNLKTPAAKKKSASSWKPKSLPAPVKEVTNAMNASQAPWLRFPDSVWTGGVHFPAKQRKVKC